MPSRRNLLIGLGASASAGGIAFGTGAFDQVATRRDAEVSIVGDGNAFLALNAENKTYASLPGGDDGKLVLQFNDSSGTDSNDSTTGTGFGQGQTYVFSGVFSITNQGSEKIDIGGGQSTVTVDGGSDINEADEANVNSAIKSFELFATADTDDDGQFDPNQIAPLTHYEYGGDQPGNTGSNIPDLVVPDDVTKKDTIELGPGDRAKVSIRVKTATNVNLTDNIADQTLNVELLFGDVEPADPVGDQPPNPVQLNPGGDSVGFASVGRALNEASAGDTVRVVRAEEGVVAGDISLDTANVTLENTADSDVDVSGRIDITAGGVTVDGFKVTVGGFMDGIVCNEAVSGVSIDNCTVTGTTTEQQARGINIQGNGGEEADVTVSGCEIGPLTCESNKDGQKVATGIFAGADDGPVNITVENTYIHDVNSNNGDARGIDVRNTSDDVKVTGSTIDAGTASGGGPLPGVLKEAGDTFRFTGDTSKCIRLTEDGGLVVENSELLGDHDSPHVGVEVPNQTVPATINNSNIDIAAGVVTFEPAPSQPEFVDATDNWWGSALGPEPLVDLNLPADRSTVRAGVVDFSNYRGSSYGEAGSSLAPSE